MKKIKASITAVGSFLPEKILNNADLEKIVDTNDDWITTRTGIKERRYATNEENSSDLAAKAALKAIENSNIDPETLDYIIVAHNFGDTDFGSKQSNSLPSVASKVKTILGIKNPKCVAYDILFGCPGWVEGVIQASAFMKAGMASKCLVIGTETLSRVIDKSDRDSMIFADGAGAVVLSADNTTGIKHSKLFSDGSYLSSLHVNNNSIDELGTIQMEGNEVFKIAVNRLSDLAEETLNECNMSSEDLTWMVPHQANIRIIKAVAKRIKLPMEKVIQTLDKHGNTSAASIPLALDVGVRDGRIKKGDTLLFEGIGGGFSWGSVLLEY